MKCIALLSGGFDSPVAVSLAQKYDIEIIALHCTNYPYTEPEPEQKCLKLCQKLGIEKLYMADCGKALAELASVGGKNYFVHLKRLFYSLAERLAQQENADFILTGENLAQVSSQTLQNLSVIDSCVKIPVLRPLLCWDKQEIIDCARKIGTHDISVGPEHCDALGPKHPATQARVEIVQEEAQKAGLEKRAEEIFSKLRKIDLRSSAIENGTRTRPRTF